MEKCTVCNGVGKVKKVVIKTPSKLYKYLVLDDRNIKMLAKRQLFLAPPEKLNDPNDLYRNYSNKHPLSSEIFTKRGKYQGTICSLSEEYNHYLMWTHYADSHKGICVEIDVEKLQVRL